MTEPSTETASAPQSPQLTGQAVSDFLGFSPRNLYKLEEQGFAQRLPNRLYDLRDTVRGYIRFLKSEDRRSSKTEQGKQKEAEQVRKLQIENAKALYELVDMETVELTFSEMFTTLRSELDAVPAGATRDLELRAVIEKLQNGAFDRCRAAFDKTRAALCSGGPVLELEDPDDP